VTTSKDDVRKLLYSSHSLGWQGITVERRSHGAGEWETPPLGGHMVCLYLGPPLDLEQRRGGGVRADRITSGMSQIVPAGVPSVWTHRETADFISLQLSTAMAARLIEEASGRDCSRLELINRFCLQDPQIEMIGRELDREMFSGGHNGSLYAESLATALMLLLLKRNSAVTYGIQRYRGGLPQKTLRLVLDYINDNLSSTLRLGELAAIAGVSPSHFGALFRRATGLAPHEYVIQRRVDRACELLRNRAMSIPEAAVAVGFYDQSHLTRHMRRVLGFSPGQLLDFGRDASRIEPKDSAS
jgi:AraC family transcriptional regulator